MLAQKQTRGRDLYYKKKNTVYSRVLAKLQNVQNASSPNSKVDRMWERLVEIALFARTGKHRASAQILKSFIRGEDDEERAKLTPNEKKRLATCFTFLAKAYKVIGASRLATDQPHFYTLVTTLLSTEILFPPAEKTVDEKGLIRKLSVFAKILEGGKVPKKIAPDFEEYIEASVRQTTHPGQRDQRQERFLQILEAL